MFSFHFPLNIYDIYTTERLGTTVSKSDLILQFKNVIVVKISFPSSFLLGNSKLKWLLNILDKCL